MGYTIIGALVGGVCEIFRLDTITGIDDWVEIGAVLGAAIGFVATQKERKARNQIERIIYEEVQRALVETH